MDILPILVGLLFVGDQVVGQINTIIDQKRDTIVSPKPTIEMGKSMVVTCSVQSVGNNLGRDFPGISNRLITKIKMSRLVQENVGVNQDGQLKEEMLAQYDPLSTPIPGTSIDLRRVYSNSFPRGVSRNSFIMEEGGDENGQYVDNAERIQVIMTTTANCELQTGYRCTFTYLDGNSEERTVMFSDNSTAKVRITPIEMAVSPDNTDFEQYPVGQMLSFDCSFEGRRGMRLEWEVQICDTDYFSPIAEARDPQIKRPETTETEKSRTACDDPIMQYRSRLLYNTTDKYCYIRCKGYDDESKEVTEFFSQNSQNIRNGTKSVETKQEAERIEEMRKADSTEMIIGIVVGLLALIVIVLLVLYFCWYKKRNQQPAADRYQPDPETKDPSMHAPPPVFFTKPGDRDNTPRSDPLETSFESKGSASRNPYVNSNPAGSDAPRGQRNRGYDGNGSLGGSLGGSRDHSLDRSYDGDESRDRQYRRRSDREKERRNRPYSTDDGTASDKGSRYGDGDPSMGTAI